MPALPLGARQARVRGAIAVCLAAFACAPALAQESAAPMQAAPAFVDSAIAAVRSTYAPDRRVARFDVEARSEGGRVVVSGETTDSAARARLATLLGARGVAFDDRILVLPDPSLGGQRWAIANNSVVNLRTVPGHASELSTQVLLGMPLRLLRRQDGFYLAQTPNGYLSWVDAGGLQLINEAGLARYRTSDRLVYLRTVGTAYSAPSADADPVLDLVVGAILRRDAVPAPDGWARVLTPDERVAFVRADEVRSYSEWIAAVKPTEAGLVATASTLMGLPYLWGGTSSKGVDCSGFTFMIYLMNGLLLPRDASQQVHVGALVDDAGDFDRLRPGDLLYFGRPATDGVPERVVHVAMWIGDGRFIHSSGRVLINSMDPAEPDFDEYNRGRYLRTKRVLGSTAGVKAVRDDALFTF